MKLRGFSAKWIQWINGCVRNPKYSVCINGRPRGRILASRGLRQGDPLSSFLFLLVSDVLSALMDKVCGSGFYECFIVGKDKIHISLLQFEEDTLLFLQIW